MRIENGKEVYEKGDFDNFAFYALISMVFIGLPYGISNDDPGFMPVAGVIGAVIWAIKAIIVEVWKSYREDNQLTKDKDNE